MGENESSEWVGYFGYQTIKLESVIDLLIQKGILTKDEVAGVLLAKTERFTDTQTRNFVQDKIKKDFT